MKPEVEAHFTRPNVVHLATVLPDGAPHCVPVWCGVEDGRIAFFTGASSRKARNIAADPRVAISVVDRDNPYAEAYVRGHVVETLEGEAAMEVVDRISHVYTGRPFPERTMTAYLVEVERETAITLPFEDTPPEP